MCIRDRSQAIAREYFGGYGSGSMADDAIGRIAEIRKLGGAGALAAGENAQVIRYGDDVSADAPIVRDGVYFDPRTNNPIAVQGPDTPPQFRVPIHRTLRRLQTLHSRKTLKLG